MEDNDVEACLEYFDSMTDEEVRRYAGQWLAVASGELVAHGEDPGRVHEEGWKAGKGEPYMRYIYRSLEEYESTAYSPILVLD